MRCFFCFSMIFEDKTFLIRIRRLARYFIPFVPVITNGWRYINRQDLECLQLFNRRLSRRAEHSVCG